MYGALSGTQTFDSECIPRVRRNLASRKNSPINPAPKSVSVVIHAGLGSKRTRTRTRKCHLAVAANGRNWYNNIDLPGTYRVMVVDGATAVTECTFDVT